MDRFSDHESFRAGLLYDLQRQLFGPYTDAADEEKNETLNRLPPLQLYATGVLFPHRLHQYLLEDSAASDTAETSENDEVEGDLQNSSFEVSDRSDLETAANGSASSEIEPLNLANEFSPSAIGISFRLADATEIIVTISYGTYQTTKLTEPHPRAGQTSMDGSIFPEIHDVPGYQRTPHEHTITVSIPAQCGKLEPIDVGGSESALKLHVMVRKRTDKTHVVSVMAVNHNNAGQGISPENADCFFQVAFQIATPERSAIFLPIDRDTGSATDDELASMELLYRHRRAFALGHGTAGDWNRDENLSETGVTDMVMTSSIPTYDLKPIKPRESAFGDKELNLSMRFLFEGSGVSESRDEILDALDALAEDYAGWIESIKKQSAPLERKLRESAEGHVKKCTDCHSRMLRGIECLRSNETAMLAFRLANKAMLVQQFHSSVLKRRELGTDFPVIPEDYKDLPGGERKWRPFQLAFILMNIAGMADQSDEERRLVDLIWFPTGGGKTEAYLGLAAYTICLERLAGAEAGTIVLMRYTLRLLTAQQFQRASALILALEVIRRDQELGADLGEDKISIGLWVGQSLTPNKRSAARSLLQKLQQQPSAQNPFQVLECPWCGVDFTNKTTLGYVDYRASPTSERTVRLICPDDQCRFSRNDSGLPIHVIDEDIYEAPPTLLIGTVDKFAQIAWEARAGRLFGIGTNTPPPSLVIQDELHLISGPLGTIVGLYETAIDRLCSRDGFVHKIVASTATIRRAQRQCLDLYNRQTFEFPPQGIRAGDSYFAFEDNSSPGRLYVGFMGTAVKSHQTALVRACSPLLQSVGNSIEESDEAKKAIVDPYGTLVWYFNSLRELGHAATLCAGDIPEYLKGLCHRLKIPPEERRYVREVIELTSRRTADEIPGILQRLEIPWTIKPKGRYPVDVLLATNMIAVGIDVSRLGLIVMSGQPKSTSEYIQATSRVGRRHPGLVLTVYTQTKSRDRSHYERFIAYHQSIYKFVEPTSVTPFSPQARERGLRGVLIALARLRAGVEKPDQINVKEQEVLDEIDFILSRVNDIDRDEKNEAEFEMIEWLESWKKLSPPEYGKMGGAAQTTTLVYPFGSSPDPLFQRDSWPMMTSMRNVDGTCTARVLNTYETGEEKKEDLE